MSEPPPTGTSDRPSDAILTVPNLITFARLGMIPVFLWLAIGADNLTAAFWLGFVMGSTDWVDGKVARRLNQVSKLGTTIDPFFDRLAIGAAAVVLVAEDLAPWPAIALVVVRDVALVLATPLLNARGVARPPVSSAGKWGSGGTMWAFGMFVAAGAFGGARDTLRIVAWFMYIPAVALSYLAAAGYARRALEALRASRAPG